MGRPPGRTLAEMLVVLALVGMLAAIVAPRIPTANEERGALRAAHALHAQLQQARTTALRRATVVTVVLDPATGRLWEAVGADAPLEVRPPVVERAARDAIAIASGELRARWTFLPSGAAFGDDVLVRDAGAVIAVGADRWTGVPHVEPR